jgi:hypothetical protein
MKNTCRLLFIFHEEHLFLRLPCRALSHDTNSLVLSANVQVEGVLDVLDTLATLDNDSVLGIASLHRHSTEGGTYDTTLV